MSRRYRVRPRRSTRRDDDADPDYRTYCPTGERAIKAAAQAFFMDVFEVDRQPAKVSQAGSTRGRRRGDEAAIALGLIGRWIEVYGDPKEGEATDVVKYVLTEMGDSIGRSTVHDLVSRYARAIKARNAP